VQDGDGTQYASIYQYEFSSCILDELKQINEVVQKAWGNRTKIKNINHEFPTVILPYIHGTTDKIAKILKKKNIRVAFSPPNSLRNIPNSLINMLDTAKDPIEPKLHPGVYAIPCYCGNMYIGEPVSQSKSS
jgi:hypothetical protein